MERRQTPPPTIVGYLEQLPAIVLLDRLPVPFVAVQPDSSIAYVNREFEQLLGYEPAMLTGVAIETVWANVPTAGGSAFAELQNYAGTIAELQHSDDYLVRAIVSRSVFVREDDPIVLVAVHDVTEQLWIDGQRAAVPGGFGASGVPADETTQFRNATERGAAE